MMSEAKINFSELPWEEQSVGFRSKVIIRGGRKLRLVEFTDEFVERGWCEKGHIGYVLDGEFEIAFPGAERFAGATESLSRAGKMSGIRPKCSAWSQD